MRLRDWKRVRQGARGGWQLHDLTSDRTEQHDLAAGEPERPRKLRALWDALAARCGVDPGGVPKKSR